MCLRRQYNLSYAHVCLLRKFAIDLELKGTTVITDSEDHVITFVSLYQVVLWNMDTLQTESMPEEHKSTITDVRFRPNSTQLATASFDKSVRLWDAANVNIFGLFFFLIRLYVKILI